MGVVSAVTLERMRSERGLRILLSLMTLLLCLRVDLGLLSEEPAAGDAAGNVELGIALATDGSLNEGGAPSMYREPLPVFVIAAQIRLDPRLSDLSRPSEHRALKQSNMVWVALILFGSGLQLLRLLPHRFRLSGMVAGVLLVHAFAVEPFVDANLTEIPAAALILWAGLLGQDLADRRRWATALLLGVVLGLLALTKAAMLYIAVVHVPLLAVLAVASGRWNVRQALSSLLTVVIVLSALVVPWMARNAAALDSWAIADRGGISLWYRAIYEQATPEEIRGSWYYFSPLPLRPAVGGLLDIRPEDLEGPLRRLDRYHPDEDEERLSFYHLARNDRRDRAVELRAMGLYSIPETTRIADKELMSRSLEVLRRDPWLFIRTAPVFLWRGTWPVLRAPLLPVPVLGLLNPLAMMALIVAASTALIRIRPDLYAVVGLPAGLVAFNALLTMYEPRFTEPALPTMSVLLVIAAVRLLDRYSAK